MFYLPIIAFPNYDNLKFKYWVFFKPLYPTVNLYFALNFDIKDEILWCLSGTRETGFLYALYTAALVYAVSQACAGNKLTSCRCATNTVVHEFSPMGSIHFCPDDVEYGAKFIRSFLNIRHKDTNQFYDTGRHNALIGLKVSQAYVLKLYISKQHK